METNFKLEGEIKETSKKFNCGCDFCHSDIPFDKIETKMIVDFMGYDYDPQTEMYYVQIDHCNQEMGLEEMRFHKSWNWIMVALKEAVKRGRKHLDFDTSDFVGIFELDDVFYGKFKDAYRHTLDLINYINESMDTKRHTELTEEAYQFFKELTVIGDSYYLSDCVEELAEELSEEEGMKLITRRNELRKECEHMAIDFHGISCSVADDFMNGVTKLWQPKFDRQVYIFRTEGEIVGLNFHQGKEIGDESDYRKPCPYLTEIYKRLREKYHNDLTAINEAMELYYIAFVLQDKVLGGEENKVFNLYADDINLLMKGLQCLRGVNKEEIKSREQNGIEFTQTLENEIYDSKGIESMLEESESVKVTIPKKSLTKGWASKHGVDFPSSYMDFETT